MTTQSKKRRAIIFQYIFPALVGALFFLVIFSCQMIFLLGITPPLKLFLAPLIVGSIAGLVIGYWKARAQALHHQLLEYQAQLQEAIKLKTLELEQKNKKLKMLACTDPLTNLGNRRLFDITIENECNRLTGLGGAISLIMCDIDMFKQYNDTYGHQRGDTCIKKVATILQKYAQRSGDLAVRLGGEEFCIIMPNTDYVSALKVAEKIRKSVESLRIPHKTSTVSDVITISLGVTNTRPIRIGWDFSLLMQAADQAMYHAKDMGRNKVASKLLEID